MAESDHSAPADEAQSEPIAVEDAVEQAADERADLDKAVAKAEEKGYFGETHSPFDNEEFSLQSGPDSPSALDQEIAIHEARVEALKSSKGDN